MTPADVEAEFDRTGRLSPRAISALRLALTSTNPYEAISVAADTWCIELSMEIAQCLSSTDTMTRWNAAATLFTRFKSKEHSDLCMFSANNEHDELVRVVALVGLGEILPLMENLEIQNSIASYLYKVFSDESLYPELRGAAYEGMLAAICVPVQDRPPANRLIAIAGDVDEELVDKFCGRFEL